jgi:2-hydroxychromene-2-carboxylate isomerase
MASTGALSVAPTGAPSVEFFFDPVCPWTWLTSRWLVDVADQTGIDVRWHALSLGMLTADCLYVTRETSEHLRPLLPLSRRALRVVEHLAAQGRNDDIARFYTAFGTALHVEREEPTDDLIMMALRVAGLEDEEPASGDHALDRAVEVSHERSQSLLPGDTGSPILAIDGKATFGPIVSPSPTGRDALTLWDAVQTLVALPAFFELKRNRDVKPQTS